MNFALGLDRTVDDRTWLMRHNAAQERTMPPREQAKEKPKAYFLKLGSGSEQVVGECQDLYHVGWIALRWFQYGASPGSSVGTGAGVSVGKPVTPRVAVYKLVDRTSSQLLVAATQGKAFTSAVIEIADEDTGIPRFRLTLTGVVLEYSGASGLSPGEAGQIESFVLDFANAQYNHNPVPEADAVDLLQAIFKNLGLAAVNDPRTSATGRGGTAMGKPGFSDIVVSKLADDSSTHLFGATREKTSGRSRNSGSSGSP